MSLSLWIMQILEAMLIASNPSRNKITQGLAEIQYHKETPNRSLSRSSRIQVSCKLGSLVFYQSLLGEVINLATIPTLLHHSQFPLQCLMLAGDFCTRHVMLCYTWQVTFGAVFFTIFLNAKLKLIILGCDHKFRLRFLSSTRI